MNDEIIRKLYDTKMCNATSFEYNIVLNTDSRLFNAMLVLIYSLSVNLNKPINLYVLQAAFPPFRKDELNNFCDSLSIKLTIVDIDLERFKDFLPGRLPKAGSFYLLAHEVLPAHCERALYLDIDTLVLKDLTKFYNVEFEGTWLAACQEYDNARVTDYLKAKTEKSDTLFRPFYCSDCLFNGGVQVLNLEKFRRENITLDDFCKYKNPSDIKAHLVIQPIVNRFTGTNIKIFPKLYYNCWSAHEEYFRKCFMENTGINEVYSHYELNEDEVNSIIHFTALPSIKPWNALMGIDTNGNLQFSPKLNKYQLKHTQSWWEYAKHIPSKNFAELISGAIGNPLSVNMDLVRIQTLKLLYELTKNTLNLKYKASVRHNWKFLQYPVSDNRCIHFEYNLTDNAIQIAFHIEYNLANREEIINAIMDTDNNLRFWSTKYGVGCYYINSDIKDSDKCVTLMKMLMDLAEPILIMHGLVNNGKISTLENFNIPSESHSPRLLIQMGSAMRNIVEYSYATQSSLSRYSNGPLEARNALSGTAPNGYAFHTSVDFKPWWIVDLGKDYPISQIKLFKRVGYSNKYHKSKITVSLSRDLEKWHRLDTHASDELGSSFIFNTRPINSRFVKVETKSTPLFFQKVEIYEDENILPFKGALIRLDKYSESFRNHLVDGSYEHPEVSWAQRLIEPSDRILEIGASIGVISCMISSTFPDIHYIAVEANPDVFVALQDNHSLNDSKYTLINAAVGSSSGEVEFHTSKNFLSSSLIKRDGTTDTIIVNKIAFDNLVEKYKPSLLICDCEGAEHEIFANSKRFNDIKKIIIEMHAVGGNVIDLFKQITNLGFKPLTRMPTKNTTTVAAFIR